MTALPVLLVDFALHRFLLASQVSLKGRHPSFIYINIYGICVKINSCEILFYRDGSLAFEYVINALLDSQQELPVQLRFRNRNIFKIA